MRYLCTICSYVYDPKIGDSENNVKTGTDFKEIPENWVCPICAANKENFEPVNE
ncbi:MAG: rubredoxin [Fusobacteriaceae bacterium]